MTKKTKTPNSINSINSKNPINQEYLFESFLPYRESLNLIRGLNSLLKIKKILSSNKNVEEQILERASFNIRCLLPNVRPANLSEDEFQETLNREKKEKEMSEEEFQKDLEEKSEDLREKIESGILDIWDDTPTFIDKDKAKSYLQRVLLELKEKLISHCQPNKSFMEKMAKNAFTALTTENYNHLPQLQALMGVWDYAKIAYEKEPPYKIVFSDQVAEQLGIDPVLESIRLQELSPLTRKEKQLLKKLKKVFLSKQEINDHPLNWATLPEVNTIFHVSQRKNLEKKWEKGPKDL
jgi:dGTP triphosphohydrolase